MSYGRSGAHNPPGTEPAGVATELVERPSVRCEEGAGAGRAYLLSTSTKAGLRMRKRLCIALAGVLAIGLIGGVASASAASEFGSGCAGNNFAPLQSLVSVAHGPSSPLPVAAPNDGIITEWKLNVDLGELTPEEREAFGSSVAQQLVVLRPAGTNRYAVVGKAEAGPLVLDGVNSFPAQIPVRQGDLLGLSGAFTLACETEDPGDAVGAFFGSAPVGATVEPEGPLEGVQVPVVAKIEPDVDHDGAADNTAQDRCPQSPAYQAPCPVVTINSKPIAGRRAVTLYVTSSLPAPVGVTATVHLGKGRTVTLSAPTQTVGPGAMAGFSLNFTRRLAKALKKVPAKRFLRCSITASATNLTGGPSTTTSTAWLKGQAKPRHGHKKKR